MRASDERGFSLIELAVVIVVVGIIVSAVAPTLRTASAAGNIAATQTELRAAAEQIDMDRAATGAYPATLAQAGGGKGIALSSVEAASIRYKAGSNSYCLEAKPIGSGTALSVVSGDPKVRELSCPL